MAPSGLTGKPEEKENFQLLEVDDLKFYIHKDILTSLKPKTKELKFTVEGYGWFRLPLNVSFRRKEE